LVAEFCQETAEYGQISVKEVVTSEVYAIYHRILNNRQRREGSLSLFPVEANALHGSDLLDSTLQVAAEFQAAFKA
jgi:hypothetical protein